VVRSRRVFFFGLIYPRLGSEEARTPKTPIGTIKTTPQQMLPLKPRDQEKGSLERQKPFIQLRQ
jgi:hypothetical protein